jgi:hypothetical protein
MPAWSRLLGSGVCQITASIIISSVAGAVEMSRRRTAHPSPENMVPSARSKKARQPGVIGSKAAAWNGPALPVRWRTLACDQ